MADRWNRMSDEDQARVWEAAGWFRLERSRLIAHLDPPPAYVRLFARAFFHRMLPMRLFRQVSGRRLPPRRWARTVRLAAPGRDEVLRHRGLRREDPVRRVTLEQLRATLRLFGFRVIRRTVLDIAQRGSTLVAMRVRSIRTGGELTLYARVRYPVLLVKPQTRTGPPCPHCATPLRTPRARQCGQCRTYWQDSADVSQA